MQQHISNSDCTSRDQLHQACSDLVPEAVRNIRKHSSPARQYDIAELEQVGHVALLKAAARNQDSASFNGFAQKCIQGEVRRFVAGMQLGPNHRTLERAGIAVSVITNASEFELIEHLPTGGNAHWVRDTVGRPPRSVCAMFASAGYVVSCRAQEKRLMRRVSRMVV